MTHNQIAHHYHVILIKPSKYDDDGYLIRWRFSLLTSNSLACLNALTIELKENKALGPEVDIMIHLFDETVESVPVKKLAHQIRTAGERAIVCITGVQTNQFARAVDLGREFIHEGLPVMIGGFHTSGCRQMLTEQPPEITDAIATGITLVAGEVEDEWELLLKAAYENRLESSYNFLNDKPDLCGRPVPILPKENLRHLISAYACIDAGRGCPFQCSFCTIINVQGNIMRGRSAEDIEKLIRSSHSQGIKHIFITDDNFARHKEWEAIADRLIYLKEKEGLGFVIEIQTDMMAHKIPGFVEKMARAGCCRVFLGLETVSPDNLKDIRKHHNKLAEYRASLQAWHDHEVITYAGYIIGFPGDNYESIMHDVEYLKREIPLDFAEFFIMTPLPGSKDHQQHYQGLTSMERDTNLYDTMHVCIKHPLMSNQELMRAYHDAWHSFYSPGHMLTILKRLKTKRMRKRTVASFIWFCSCIYVERMHPLLGGFFRVKGWKNRRPELPRENILLYYPRRLIELILSFCGLIRWALELYLLGLIAARSKNAAYSDHATSKDLPKTISADPLK